MVSYINLILHKRHFVGVAQVLILHRLKMLSFQVHQLQVQLAQAQFMRGHSSQPGWLQLRIQLQQKLRQVKDRLLLSFTALLILCLIGKQQQLLMFHFFTTLLRLTLALHLQVMQLSTFTLSLKLTQTPIFHQYHIMLQLPFTHQRNQDPLSWQHHWLSLL